MCDMTRREFMAGTTAVLGMISTGEIRPATPAQAGQVDKVSTDIFSIRTKTDATPAG